MQTFEDLKIANLDEREKIKKDLINRIASNAYYKGFEKGIVLTEESVEKNNVEFLIQYFKDKIIYFKNWIVHKAELLNVTYPEMTNIQKFYELKGELKAIKEFGYMYLNIDFNVELAGQI